MAEKKWYTVNDAVQFLPQKDAAAIRRWIRKGREEKWLRVGKHIKPAYPNAVRPTWLINVDECLKVGDRA